MEKKLHFETINSTELGLQMIDEALLEDFRTRFKIPLLTKWNPRWRHRDVSPVHHGNGEYSIYITGLTAVLARSTVTLLHVNAAAHVIRRKGCNFPVTVIGSYASGHNRDLKYPLEKKEFPKDW